MKKQSTTRNRLDNILELFNNRSKELGSKDKFTISYCINKQPITIKDKEGFIETANIKLECIREDKGLLLYSYSIPLSKSNRLDYIWQEQLTTGLLYEVLGLSCLSMLAMTESRIKQQEIVDRANEEKDTIRNKKIEDRTEEEGVINIIDKISDRKVQKTGLVDRFGDNIVSETITG